MLIIIDYVQLWSLDASTDCRFLLCISRVCGVFGAAAGFVYLHHGVLIIRPKIVFFVEHKFLLATALRALDSTALPFVLRFYGQVGGDAGT